MLPVIALIGASRLRLRRLLLCRHTSGTSNGIKSVSLNRSMFKSMAAIASVNRHNMIIAQDGMLWLPSRCQMCLTTPFIIGHGHCSTPHWAGLNWIGRDPAFRSSSANTMQCACVCMCAFWLSASLLNCNKCRWMSCRMSVKHAAAPVPVVASDDYISAYMVCCPSGPQIIIYIVLRDAQW